MNAPALRSLPIEQLRESPLNPRKHFDQHALTELAESIRTHGVLTPLTARVNSNGHGQTFEIGAGHRRFRAAQLAGLSEVPVIVRDLDDVAFVELLTIDNLQRDNLHPMEEAQGFAALMMKGIGYDVAKIAERTHRSHQYVYDRLRLLKLTPKAQELFLRELFPLSHAILLARLSPADQERAIDPEAGQGGRSLFYPYTRDLFARDRDEDRDPWAGLKFVSLAEFQDWIDEHVRFDPKADIVPDLFPDTAESIAAAEERKQKVLYITHEYRVADDARDANGVRTFGNQAWKRADGEEKSKTCQHAALGVVAAGEGRGDAFLVCVEKKKCEIHWPDEAKAAKQKAKLQTKADAGDESAKAKLEREKKAEAARVAKAEAAAALRRRAIPLINAQVRDAIDGMAEDKLVRFALDIASGNRHDALSLQWSARTKEKVPTTAVRLLRIMLTQSVEAKEYVATWDHGFEQFVSTAKSLGVNVDKILKAAESAPEQKAPAKKAAKKGGKR